MMYRSASSPLRYWKETPLEAVTSVKYPGPSGAATGGGGSAGTSSRPTAGSGPREQPNGSTQRPSTGSQGNFRSPRNTRKTRKKDIIRPLLFFFRVFRVFRGEKSLPGLAASLEFLVTRGLLFRLD